MVCQLWFTKSLLILSHSLCASHERIFRKGDKNDPSNYRPISSLPILSKIFESDMKNQMTLFTKKKICSLTNNLASDKITLLNECCFMRYNNGRTESDQAAPCYIGEISLDVRKCLWNCWPQISLAHSRQQAILTLLSSALRIIPHQQIPIMKVVE